MTSPAELLGHYRAVLAWPDGPAQTEVLEVLNRHADRAILDAPPLGLADPAELVGRAWRAAWAPEITDETVSVTEARQ